MKKIRNILFVAIGLFMITFALVGCSKNNEASEDVSRRASLVSTSNQVSTANLSTTTSTTAISLEEAVENNIKFDKIIFDKSHFVDTLEGYLDNCDEFSAYLVGNDCTFFDQGGDFDGYDRNIEYVYYPIWSSQLNRFICYMWFRYGDFNSDRPYLISLGFASIDETISTYTDLEDYIIRDYLGSLDSESPLRVVIHTKAEEDGSYQNMFDENEIDCYGDSLSLDKSISISTQELDSNGKLIMMGNSQYLPSSFDVSNSMYYYPLLISLMVEPSDTDNPTINIPTVNVDVDNPIPFSEIKAQITATDPTEGDITSKIEIVSNEYVLDANGKIPVGNYEYVVKVTDEALNSSEVTGLICVQDTKAPVVTANNATTLYNVTLTDEEIRSLFNYSDNYDSTGALNVVINRDAYTNTLGTYDITCKVTDLSGNTGEATAKVTVYDNIRPTIYTPKNLTLSTVSPINYDDVFAKCGAYDGYDGEIEFTLTDTDKMVETKAVGSYTWTIEASDSTGNTSTETFEIIIVDKDIPVINFNTDYFFFTSRYNLLTKDEIVSMLLKTSQVTGSVESNNIESITSDYFNSPHEVGEYDLKVKLSDGTTYDNTVVVTEEPEKEFKFTDIFTKIYWETWANNWKTPDNWNWLHWTIISIGAVAVLAAVVAVLKKKR